MIKVSVTSDHYNYIANKENGTHDPRMFFDLNGDDYEFVVHGAEPIDILILTAREFANGQFRTWKNYKIALLLDLWHGVEGHIAQLIKQIEQPNEFVITCMGNVAEHPQIISNDFMFNRSKAYYSQFPFSPGVTKWYNYGQLSYIAPELTDAEHKKKIFVSPCKTYPDRPRRSRNQLRDILRDEYMNFGYLGNIDEDPTLFLYPHIEFPWCNNIEEIETQTRPLSYSWWGYCPPHNEYYRNTFVSIYSETVEFGTHICVSEKTYDPMIKGHFVLPFSNCNFVSWVQDLGFKFPDFINYEYDSISDDNKRLEAYLVEVRRILNMPLLQWKQHYTDNINMLKHNQLMFHRRAYHQIDIKKLLKTT